MKINHNIAAQIANVNLKKDEARVSNSLGKLSSGYKITKAADDSAGLAISNKMRTQIRALDQASRNAEDGQSIVQTADGALNEVMSILHRIRELGVQNANDTYTLEDRDASQNEIDQLLDEIDRISSTTEFNGKSLLDGSSARAVTSSVDGVIAMKASMAVPKGTYQFEITEPAEKARLEGFSYSIPASGTSQLIINGTAIELSSSDTADSAEQKIVDACSKMDIDAECSDGAVNLTTRATGSRQKLTISQGTSSQSAAGKDVQLELAQNDEGVEGGFSENAKISSDGSQVTIKDNGGFEMFLEVPPVNPAGGDLADSAVTLTVYEAGYMGMQIGANEFQVLNMNFDEISCHTLSLRDNNGQNLINVCSQHGAGQTIAAIDGAIQKVSAARSELGAYQNRLEDTVSSLDVAVYNVTNSMSRIIDTDMAEEMTQYTQLTVLQQAATSMLSQANNKPQEIMNLLQGM
ncbi:MAG TPA: hypothetical protein DCZ23_01055 [Lachnospiraceae bacterium]|nr:hypothetical protein [Lachnospiraceae bacterium]